MPGGDLTRRVALAAAAGVAGLWALGRIWPLLWALLWPFLAGGALAVLVEAPMGALARRGLSRGLAAALCLGAVMAAALFGAAWMAAAAWQELARLRRHLPALVAALAAAAARGGGALAGVLPPWLRAELGREAARGLLASGPLLQHVLARAQGAAAGVSDGLFGLLLAVTTAFFLCRDRPLIAAWLDGRLRGRAGARIRLVAASLRDSAWGLARAQLLLALATFVTSLAGLLLIGAPYAMLGALAAAVFDFLPVVGPGLLYVPWIVGAAANHLPGAAVALCAVFAAVVGIRFALTPRLMGSQVGLHPWVALAAMYVGVKEAGVVGLLLGPVVAALVQAVYRAIPPSPPPPDPWRPGARSAAGAEWYNPAGAEVEAALPRSTPRPGNGGGRSSPRGRAGSR